jgi:hypothetical protein
MPQFAPLYFIALLTWAFLIFISSLLLAQRVILPLILRNKVIRLALTFPF